MTPQRRQFSYPKDLARTEDHDALIARYRRDNDLPVLELDEDQVSIYNCFKVRLLYLSCQNALIVILGSLGAHSKSTSFVFMNLLWPRSGLEFKGQRVFC